MRTTHRPFRSLLVLIVLLLGLTAAPAGIVAQDDDDSDPPAVTTTQDDGDSDPDVADEGTPDCDENGWRILTTEDGAGFASEDHCEDHVAEHGAANVVVVGAEEDAEYVAVTLADPTGDQCRYTVTLVNGQDGQIVDVVIYVSDRSFLASTLTTAEGEDSFTWGIHLGQWLERGTANLETTGEAIPIHMPNMICG